MGELFELFQIIGVLGLIVVGFAVGFAAGASPFCRDTEKRSDDRDEHEDSGYQ